MLPPPPGATARPRDRWGCVLSSPSFLCCAEYDAEGWPPKWDDDDACPSCFRRSIVYLFISTPHVTISTQGNPSSPSPVTGDYAK